MPHKPRSKRGRTIREFRRAEQPEGPSPAVVTAPVTSPTISAVKPAVAASTVASRPAQPVAVLPDLSQVRKELKRIAVIAGSMFVIIVILSFFLR